MQKNEYLLQYIWILIIFQFSVQSVFFHVQYYSFWGLVFMICLQWWEAWITWWYLVPFFCSWSCSTALWQSEVLALGWTVSDSPELPRSPLLTHLVAHLPLNYHHSSWISAGSVLLTPLCPPPPPTWSAHHWLREFLFWFAVPSILPFFFIFPFYPLP